MKRLSRIIALLLLLLVTACSQDAAPEKSLKPSDLDWTVLCKYDEVRSKSKQRGLLRHYLKKQGRGPRNLQAYLDWNKVDWNKARIREFRYWVSSNGRYDNVLGWMDVGYGEHTVSVQYHINCDRSTLGNFAKVNAIQQYTFNKTWKSGSSTMMINYGSRENKMVWSEGSKQSNGKFKNKTTYVYSVKGIRRLQVLAASRLYKISGNGSNLSLPESMLTGLHTPLRPGVDVNIYALELTRDDTCPVCQGYYDTWDRKKGIYEQEYKEYRDAVDDANGAEDRFQKAVAGTVTSVSAGLLACGSGILAGCGVAMLSLVVGGAITVRASSQVDREESEKSKRKDDMEAAESSMNNALARV